MLKMTGRLGAWNLVRDVGGEGLTRRGGKKNLFFPPLFDSWLELCTKRQIIKRKAYKSA